MTLTFEFLWPSTTPVLALLLFALPRRLRRRWSRRILLVVLMLASLCVAAVVMGCADTTKTRTALLKSRG